MRFSLLTLLVLLLCVANLLVGSVALSPSEVGAVLTGGGAETLQFIVYESRIPQLVTALFAGAALAGSGLIMQTLFRNPLADPSILGVSAGAGLGAAIALLLLGGTAAVIGTANSTWLVLSGFVLTALFSLIGALAVIALLTVASVWLRGSTGLLVVGVMLSFLVSSITSLLNFFATDEGVRSYVMWGLGNFSGATGERLLLYIIGITLILVLIPLLLKPLDALLLGDNYAQSLGVNVRRWRTILLILVGWLTALTTAVCGPISFIGLAVPHGARLMMKTANHRKLLPATLLLGSITTLACLLLTHLPAAFGFTHAVLPLSAITPLIGAPIVIYILVRH